MIQSRRNCESLGHCLDNLIGETLKLTRIPIITFTLLLRLEKYTCFTRYQHSSTTARSTYHPSISPYTHKLTYIHTSYHRLVLGHLLALGSHNERVIPRTARKVWHRRSPGDRRELGPSGPGDWKDVWELNTNAREAGWRRGEIVNVETLSPLDSTRNKLQQVPHGLVLGTNTRTAEERRSLPERGNAD
jgi:hypothetical protein